MKNKFTWKRVEISNGPYKPMIQYHGYYNDQLIGKIRSNRHIADWMFFNYATCFEGEDIDFDPIRVAASAKEAKGIIEREFLKHQRTVIFDHCEEMHEVLKELT